MAKLIITQGLPASGKSTWAKSIVASDDNYVRVNKDLLREMLNASVFRGGRTEKNIIKARDTLVEMFLKLGKWVIVDDTNLNPVHAKSLQQLASRMGVAFEVKDDFLKVSVEECIKRDLARPNSVGEKVIRDMYKQYLAPEPIVYTPDPTLPEAVIVDMDGTLADNNHRSPFDYDKCDMDGLNPEVARFIASQHEAGRKIVVCSGREDSCKAMTQAWLDRHGIHCDAIFMRKTGDHRKDAIVKREIFDANIMPFFNVVMCIDDRQQVCQMYRNIGLIVWQVAEGNF